MKPWLNVVARARVSHFLTALDYGPAFALATTKITHTYFCITAFSISLFIHLLQMRLIDNIHQGRADTWVLFWLSGMVIAFKSGEFLGGGYALLTNKTREKVSNCANGGGLVAMGMFQATIAVVISRIVNIPLELMVRDHINNK